jgi:fructose-1,6-bisphosphatase II / sedoheptulose-1,7-bisphosphatase
MSQKAKSNESMLYNEKFTLGRNLALDAARVTESAALAASKWMGLGQEKAADQAAVDAMRRALNSLDIDGTVVIGEGERDKAPMLYIGEKVGTGEGPEVDIALDPLEGTTICATGGPNSLAVMAMTQKGGFLHAPDVYMDKIAVGAGLPEGVVSIEDAPLKNLKNLAKAKGCEVSDLVVVILERARHEQLIAKVREAGARIQLIGDGDVAGVIATSRPETRVDMYIGTGGAPEGVLAAAALRCVGGQMQGRLLFDGEEEQKQRATRMGIKDFNKIYTLEEMAHGEDVMFAATGVTSGWMLEGVKRFSGSATTHSLVMRSRTGTIRTISTEHNFTRKPGGVLLNEK